MTDRTVSYSFRANFQQFTAGLAAAGRGVQDLGTRLTATDRAGQQMRASLAQVGDVAGKVGLAAAAGLGAIVVASANFDDAMSKVDAATHESAKNMELLRAAAIKAGADTVFSATEAADAITALSKAGVSTNDILKGGLSGALALASAGELDVATAADIAATAMNQFGLAGKDIPHIADLLAAAAGKAQGEVTDMALAFKYVGPVANQMGISIEETTGAIAELAAQGILADSAGTALRGILSSLSSPSKIAAQQMKNLGINLYDARGQFVGFKGVAGELQKSLSTLSNEERDQALGRIFGNEQITAARILYAGGASAVEKWTKAVDADGFAADTAARKMNNLHGDIQALTGSLETLLITSGDGAQGPLRTLAQNATNAVNALNAMPGPAKNVATGLLAITAVTGGALWFSSKALGGVVAMRGALAGLGIEAATTRALLASLSTAFVATGLGLGTVLDGLSILDSRSRSGAAADAQVKSFQDLSDALQFSNVGKYANDLHINLDRLTQDLAENGAKGEYAARVLDDLGKHSHGAGAALNSLGGNILPFYTAKADKAYDANKDLKAIIEDTGGAVFETGKVTGEAAVKTEQLATKQREAEETSKAAAKAIRDQAESFVGLGKNLNDSKVSLNDWIRGLAKQAQALRDFTSNAITAGKKGLNEGLIASLRAAGPEGALRLKQLADGSKTQIARANEAFLAGRHAVNEYANAFNAVPKDVTTHVHLKIDSNLTKFRQDVASGFGLFNPSGAPRKGGLDGDPKTPFFDGGFTGYGDPRAPAGVVHGREYVFSAAATQGHERELDALHRSLRGYASGGYVGALPSSSGAGIDYDRLATAVINARPLMGNVTVQDGTDFMRVLNQAKATASLSGMPS